MIERSTITLTTYYISLKKNGVATIVYGIPGSLPAGRFIWP